MMLEQLLRSHAHGRFCLDVHGIDDTKVKVYIHPDGEDGETLEYYVSGDGLVPCSLYKAAVEQRTTFGDRPEL